MTRFSWLLVAVAIALTAWVAVAMSMCPKQDTTEVVALWNDAAAQCEVRPPPLLEEPEDKYDYRMERRKVGSTA